MGRRAARVARRRRRRRRRRSACIASAEVRGRRGRNLGDPSRLRAFEQEARRRQGGAGDATARFHAGRAGVVREGVGRERAEAFAKAAAPALVRCLLRDGWRTGGPGGESPEAYRLLCFGDCAESVLQLACVGDNTASILRTAGAVAALEKLGERRTAGCEKRCGAPSTTSPSA